MLLLDPAALVGCNAPVDVLWPDIRVLAVGRVEREVERLLIWGKLVERGLDVLFKVLRNGDDEKW